MIICDDGRTIGTIVIFEVEEDVRPHDFMGAFGVTGVLVGRLDEFGRRATGRAERHTGGARARACSGGEARRT